MSIESVKEYLAKFGLGDRVMEFDASSATVAQAAADLGCEPARIAKTMAFLLDGHAILVVMAGDGKVDNLRYKATFHTKAAMVRPDQLVELVGQPHGRCMPLCHPGERACLSGRELEAFFHRLPPQRAPPTRR